MVCHAHHRTDSGCICCSDDAALSETADQKCGSEVILFSFSAAIHNSIVNKFTIEFSKYLYYDEAKDIKYVRKINGCMYERKEKA